MSLISVLTAGLCAVVFYSCNEDAASVSPQKDTAVIVVPAVPKQEMVPAKDSLSERTSGTGEHISGDFDGDGTSEYATVVKVKEGSGNPVDGGTPDRYEVQFSTGKIKSLAAGCCEIRLVNEGDLNKDGADELSLFQAPENGCTYTMSAYSFKTGEAALVVPPFLIPTGCDPLSDEALKERIFAAAGGIYFYNTDMSDEAMPLKKYKVRQQ